MNEQSFLGLIGNITVGIIALDSDWRVVFINKVADEMLNRSPGDLINKNIWAEFPEAVGGHFHRAYKEAFRKQEVTHIHEYSTTTGKWIQAAIYPSQTGLTIYFQDITKERIAEHKVLQSEADYKAFIERITDGFIALDKNFCYTYVNKRIGELVHRDPESLIGKNVWEEFPDAVGSLTYKAFMTAFKEQRFISNIDYYEPLDLWQENYIYPSPDGLSVFINDISDRKKLERELLEKERRQQLALTSAMLKAQERERTLIGQELHDNVNQIIVGTKLILSFIRDNPEKLHELIPACINNLEKVIRENRKIAHELVTPDLKQGNLINELSNLVHSMLTANGIEAMIDATGFNEQMIDEQSKLAIYRVAQEQCTNIIKYSKAKKATFTLETSKKELIVSIADDGVGMAQSKISAGIGLRNMEARIAFLDGTFQVETSPGKGFSLYISIPLER
jgi:signal transduction histidine kinase